MYIESRVWTVKKYESQKVTQHKQFTDFFFALFLFKRMVLV